jgi:hypothetical protein
VFFPNLKMRPMDFSVFTRHILAYLTQGFFRGLNNGSKKASQSIIGSSFISCSFSISSNFGNVVGSAEFAKNLPTCAGIFPNRTPLLSATVKMLLLSLYAFGMASFNSCGSPKCIAPSQANNSASFLICLLLRLTHSN